MRESCYGKQRSGGEGFDPSWSARQIAVTSGYILTGITTLSDGISHGYLLKTDLKGKLLWQKTLPGYGYDIQQTSDGGYVVGGTTDSFGNGSFDVYLLKLRPEGPPPRLNIYRPDTNQWLPLTDQIIDERFTKTAPTVVLVHGWNSELIDQLPTYLNDLASGITTRIPSGVNVLAWDWVEEAKGNAKLPFDLLEIGRA